VIVVDVVGAETPNDVISDSWMMVGMRMFLEPALAGCESSRHELSFKCPDIRIRGIDDSMCGRREISSGVFPENVTMMIVSLGRTTPRSPCKASIGCRNTA
jgi:hypothetical protein